MATAEQNLRHGPTPTFARSEMMLRADRLFRFERGGTVYSSDGRIGTLRQVVVDERAGEVTALIIEIDKTNELVFLPPQAVSKTGGSAIFLSGTHRQYEEWLEQAARYNPKRGVKVNFKSLLHAKARPDSDPRQAIVNAGRDFLETGRQAPTSRAAASGASNGRSNRR